MDNDEKQDSNTFELSLRILGNEFIGIRITENEFKGKWLILSLIFIMSMFGIISAMGPTIEQWLNSDQNSEEISEVVSGDK